MTIVAIKPTLTRLRAPYNAQNAEDLKAWTDAVSTAGDAGTLAGGALSADAPGRAVMATGYFTEAKATNAFAASAISAALLKPSQIDGTQVKVGAAANTIGIISELFIIAVTDGSTVQTGQTLNATYGKIIVDDVHFVKGATTGGATDAVQLCTDAGGTTPVSSSLALNAIVEGGVVRTASLLNTAFAAGAIFYVKRTSTTNNAGTLYIKAHRVA
jgi:hypothetical protein